MAEDNIQLQQNIISLFTLQAATYVFPLIMTPYLVRVLGVERFGKIAFAMAICQYFVILADYGFNLSATRQAALLRDNPNELSRLINAVFAIKGALILVGTIVLVSIVALLPNLREDWLLYLTIWPVVIGHLVFPVWLIQGVGRMEIITRCMVGAQLIVFICIYIFVITPHDYRIAAGLQAFTPILAGIFSWVALRRVIRFTPMWPGITVLRETALAGWHIFISTVAISFYTATNIVVLGFLTNNTAVGYYSAADRLIKAVQGLVSPVSQAVFPYIARLQEESKSSALAFIARLLRWQGLTMLILSLTVFFFADQLVEILFGSGFEDSKILVKLMAMTPFLVGVSNVLGIQTMLNFGMKRPFSAILLCSGIVNLALLIFLVPLYGVPGAALSVLMTEAIVVIAMIAVLVRLDFGPSLLRWS